MPHGQQEAPDSSLNKPSLVRVYSLAFLALLIGLAAALILDAQTNDGSGVSIGAVGGTLVVSIPAIILGASGAFERAPGKSIAFLAVLVAAVMMVETIVLQ